MVSLLIEVELIEFDNILFKKAGVFFKVERFEETPESEDKNNLGEYVMTNKLTNFKYIGKLKMEDKKVKVFESSDELFIVDRKFIEVTYLL